VSACNREGRARDPHQNIAHPLGPEYSSELEYLRSYVRTLRKKIEDDAARPKYIVTEPWVGYRFCDSSDPQLSATETKSF
jgi:two-component system KDP operon response regulator KdpE